MIRRVESLADRVKIAKHGSDSFLEFRRNGIGVNGLDEGVWIDAVLFGGFLDSIECRFVHGG